MKRLFVAFIGVVLCLTSLATRSRADAVVVFNEVMYHPATNEVLYEWIELRNLLAVDVDISDWSLTGMVDYTFPSNSIIRGGQYLIVARIPSVMMSQLGTTNVHGPFIGRLDNDGGLLRLRNNSGRVMDELTYGTDGDWPVAPDGAGVSLAKRDPNTASGPAANWTASEQVGGTPAGRNFSSGGFDPPPGLVSWWPFNEPSGSTIGDQVGANSGTFASGVTRVSSSVGGALSFNGTSNAFANVGAGASFNVAAGLTIEAVIMPGWSTTNSAVIFRKAIPRPLSYRDAVLTNSPVAYWRLDDVSTTIADSSGNGRVGTATAGVQLGQPSLVPSQPGNTSVRATGSNRITVPGFEKIGALGYTVEFWVKVNTLPNACCQSLVGDGEAAGDYFMMNYILGPNQGVVGAIRPHFGPANSPVSMDSVTALQAGGTYHVVSTWDTGPAANNAVIYINGVADRTGTISRNVPAAGTTGANPVYIGYDNRDVPQGDYTYDEVALYNKPLSAADVAAHYAAASTVNFDVTQGNAIQLAFQDDGNNAAANPPVAAGPVLSFGLTVGGVYRELDMPLDGASGRPTLAALENGQPHHIAATFDSASGLKAIYIDGTLRFSVTEGGGLNGNNAAAAIIGNSQVNGSTPFVGTLDEMAYWSKALTAGEVAAHWNSIQAGRDYFAPNPASAPARLAFNELSPSTNATFWLEIVNYGTNPLSLAGIVLVRDGPESADNEYVFPAGPPLSAGAFLTLSNSTLGFLPLDGDRLFLLNSSRDRVLDSVVVTRGARARVPAGTGPLYRPTTPTPGTANVVTFRDEIVINEIMYDPKRLPSTNGLPPAASGEKWVELYNKSSNAVDLTGWEFDGGIRYRFSAGQSIPAGGYLVVAGDVAALSAKYPGITIVGDFSGNLSGSSDHLVLFDPAGNPADELRYFGGGRWPEYANGGGSSLELRDPASDNSKAEAWAASDESTNGSWFNVSYRLTALQIPYNRLPATLDGQWRDFVFGLQEAGECLIDDLSVIQAPLTSPLQCITNGNFDNGLVGWRVLGTHNQSRIVPDPDSPGNNVLRLVATGPQEHMHNHIEATLIPGRTITTGVEYQISYRVRWLAGSSLLNTRLYFNRVGRTTEMPYGTRNGTPGRRNSRWEPNIGPTFTGLSASPVAPPPGIPVTVSVTAQDSQGVASAQVWWSVNSGAWNNAAMTALGGGLLSGTIPGANAGDVVQFYVRAVDNLGAAATFPARGTNSGALYKVADGQAILTQIHNVRVIVTPAIADLMHGTAQGVNQTNVMSNELFPCTIVYDEARAYYDCGVHLRGSQRGRYSDIRTGFHIEFQPDDLFRGVHPVMLVDRSGAGDAQNNRQEEIILKHMLNRAGGLPGTHSEIARVLAPRPAHTGTCQFFPRHEDAFIESAFENGGDGTQFEMELIYWPLTANPAGYKLPQPDDVTGLDLSDLGNDKEPYRYNFMLKNHRDEDDYRDFIYFCKTLSLSGAQLDAQSRLIMDVNQWMRAYAMVSLGSVGDMYSFGNNHNFFTYQRPSDGKFIYMPWDMDFTFTRLSNGALVGDQNISKVVNLPGNLRCMYAHMLDIIGTCFNSSYMSYWTAHYASLAGQNYSGHQTTIGARATYVMSQITAAGGNAPFNITSATNVSLGTNVVIITGTAPVSAHTIRVNGIEYPITWTSVSSWTIRVPVSQASQVLNLVGYDLYGRALTNFSRTVNVTNTVAVPDPAGIVIFNEIMYNPTAPNASFIELFNTSTNITFDLSGWRINGVDYTFPGSVIGPRSFLVLVSDARGYYSAYGSGAPIPFATYGGSLQNDGETLTLVRPGNSPGTEIVVDKVRYESGLPWPQRANGLGSSLQLIDSNQDNTRVANWTDGTGWRYFTFTGLSGPAAINAFAIFLANAGELYVDNVSLVQGSTPGAGPNLLVNGSFEDGMASWGILGNHAASIVTNNVAAEGTNSLLLRSTGAGIATSQAVTQSLAGIALNTTHTVSFYYLPSTSTATGLHFRVSSALRTQTPIDVRPGLPTPGATNSVAASITPFPPVWLNEVQADNLAGPMDGQGEREPWVELYNSGTNIISLAGYYLADNYSNLTQWAFPAGAQLQPGEFKIVFCDGETNETTPTEWHTGFRLPSTSGSVALSWTPGALQLLDYLNYSGIPAGRSYGDYPNGQTCERQEFYVVTPGNTNDNSVPPLTVYLNEWMADNSGVLLNTNNNNLYSDWFELHNPTAAPADLRGFYLTDNLGNPDQFEIPAGYVIPPFGFLVVWADGRPDLNTNTDPALHVNFQLSQAGEAIGLFGGDGSALDTVTFEPQYENISEGRFPDGPGTNYFLASPTPGASNSIWLNRYPTIAAIPDATAYVGLPFEFTVNATEPDVPSQILLFTLDAAPTNAMIDVLTGEFSWTPVMSQLDTTNLITVRVTDTGPLNLSATNSFTVVVRMGLLLGGIMQGPGGTISFSVGTIPGKTYRVQYKDDLNDLMWTHLPPDHPAMSTSLQITDTITPGSQRFYQVIQLD